MEKYVGIEAYFSANRGYTLLVFKRFSFDGEKRRAILTNVACLLAATFFGVAPALNLLVHWGGPVLARSIFDQWLVFIPPLGIALLCLWLTFIALQRPRRSTEALTSVLVGLSIGYYFLSFCAGNIVMVVADNPGFAY